MNDIDNTGDSTCPSCGALGVKWAFGTDLGHGLIVFLMSLSSATLVAMTYLLLVF